MMPRFYRASRHKRGHRHNPGHDRREAREQQGGGEGGRDLRTSRVYYFITGVFQGKRFLYGPKLTEWEAQQFGAAKCEGDFTIVPLHTRDLAAASRELKAKLLDEENLGLGEATRRLSHR